MDSLFVEEVAASLVREFLSRKGLKRTCVTMDQERPRTDLSINSRNNLRKVLHLEFLYKENKAKENPLKTNLELITRYFLDHFENTANNFAQKAPMPALSLPKKSDKLPLRYSETTLVNIYDLADEDAAWRTSLSEASKARHDNHDGDVLGNLVSSKRPPHKSKPAQAFPVESPLAAAPEWEKVDKLPSSEPSSDTKRAGEKTRTKPGLIVRGMMAGPTASSPQDSLRRRSLRRPLVLSGMTLPHEEEEGCRAPGLPTHTPACPAPQEGLASSTGSTSRIPPGQLSEPATEKHGTTPSSPLCLPSQGLPQKGSGRGRGLSGDSPTIDGGPEASGTPSKFSLPGGNARTTQERLERAFTRQGNPLLPLRKNQLPVTSKADGELGALQLEDVEDDESIREEVILSPAPSMPKLQTVSKPIDLSVAKDLKTVLFGSSTGCFSEEWKLQSFSFSDAAPLRYGIVQNKGGPCGVLAAVQGCVLQKLLFEGDRADCARQLQPSSAHRTHCLALAIADILWRAGGHERAVVTLPSGTQQFIPTGKYKADGVLETLMLHSVTCHEELVAFLQQSVHQFEVGPFGCILLTLSAILSRSTELIRQDFDVPTNHLIGAHSYCTQELVNLLLTGRAVSNVFNDVVELDAGNGNVTLLKGISARSDVGLLSLFEHYDVCQVGCFLKTPRFPIWVVCSESHFSILFSLQPGLLRDWRTERLFDLYYYDGLANQQEQIRLTIDTTQTVPEDRDSDLDLIPPLELCIRTKWKGASVNWNGSDPIL
ncbi:probable ubiquitin carboxyl-terminal hydrolase MINDY-4 [Sturnira hondurensis]|uniref:probable ubiquitin carboxyl-terminal hydrolase MINDY-4 n=1 Tax=Sturnira hondurensis TaxID=192404 RepID=UPI0018796329|nr:probable ubiquitin carboxyl-terminal hydrolase MINDY-4 [Sturnira hondurensis]